MFSSKNSTWSFFRSTSPVNIPTGDVLTTTINTTMWLYSKIAGTTPTTTATAEFLPEHKTAHQSAEAFSKEELDALLRLEAIQQKELEAQKIKLEIEQQKKREAQRKLEAEQQAARLRIQKRKEERKKLENALIKKELASLNLPPKAMLFSEFEIESKNEVQCFHQIFMVTREGKRYFYKKNEPNSPMSELEAYCRGAMDFIAHHHVPADTIPVYNKLGEFVGVCCEEIPGFTPVGKTNFDVADFRIRMSQKKIMTPPMLAKLDAWARDRDIDLQHIVKDQSIDENDFVHIEDSDEIFLQEANFIKTVYKQEEWFKSKSLYSDNPSEILDLVKTCASDLIKFRKVKGYSIGYTARIYIGKDDDLHNNNIGSGRKKSAIDIYTIDNDMTNWPVLYKHKNAGPIDNYTRDPSSSGLIFRLPTGRFTQTRNDIAMLPRTKDLTAFYRPCSGILTVPERVHDLMSKAMSLVGVKNFDFTQYLAKNAYSEESRAAFSSLTTNDVAIYYKFKTLLQFILTNPSHYSQLGEMYVRKDVPHEGQQTIREALLASHIEDLTTVKHELYNMGYNLELTHQCEPKDYELKPNSLYVFLDYYGSITLKAKNSKGLTEYITLTKKDLGEAYDSIHTTLSGSPVDKTTLDGDDLEILAGVAAGNGFAVANTKYEFKQFLRDYGDVVKNEIFAEFEDINRHNERQIFDMDQIKDSYADLMGLAGAVYSDEQDLSRPSSYMQNANRLSQTLS